MSYSSFISGGLLLILTPVAALAQSPTVPTTKPATQTEQLPAAGRSKPADDTAVFTHVDQMPQFPGGQQALLQTLARTVYYPSEALQQRQEGRVFVSFVVDATGAVQDAQVIKPMHSLLDKEAIRAIEALPDFVPGKQLGQPCAVRLTLPITFRLPTNVDEVLAQRTKSTATEDGPAEFSGGPEALRTYLNAVPLPAGFQPGDGPLSEVFVSFVVDAEGKVGQVQGLPPLPAETHRKQHQLLQAAAISYLSAMPAWTPARLRGQAVAITYTVPVRFSGTPPHLAYAYAGQMPVFSYPDGERAYIAQHVRYPASALRSRTGGVVLTYYEVAENGLVENVKTIQSVTPSIDAEVKRVLQTSFPAYQPAQQQGKPVRVFFIIPTDFKIL